MSKHFFFFFTTGSCGEHIIHIISFHSEKDVEPGKKSEKIPFALVSFFFPVYEKKWKVNPLSLNIVS